MYRLFTLSVLFILFLLPQALGQSQLVVSYFPSSAFVTGRLLPFVVGPNVREVINVEILSGDECQSLIDPYYKSVFHIQCEKPSLVSARIRAETNAGNEIELSIKFINIFNESEPGQPWSTDFKLQEGNQ